MVRYDVTVGERTYAVELERTGPRSGSEQHKSAANADGETSWKVRIDGREVSVNCLQVTDKLLSLIVDGESFETRSLRSADALTILLRGRSYECVALDPRSLRNRKPAGLKEAGEQKIVASMPGKVVRVLAQAGQTVAVGQEILVIEAMKMQNEVRAVKDGILKSIVAKQGTNVNAGDVLAIIE
jgi:biotin carboxyl carrier protein